MKRLLVIVLGVGWAFAGFRNLPRLDQPYASAAGLAIAGSLAAAFWAGTRVRRDAAVAAAVARAEATAAAVASSNASAMAQQHVVVNVHEGARARGAAEHPGLSDAPWIVGHHRAIELDEADAVQSVLDDVLEDREAETA